VQEAEFKIGPRKRSIGHSFEKKKKNEREVLKVTIAII